MSIIADPINALVVATAFLLAFVLIGYVADHWKKEDDDE